MEHFDLTLHSGGQIGGFLMSQLGRKGGMMVCATMSSFSLLLLAAASNVPMIYAGRICSGVCTGKIKLLNTKTLNLNYEMFN